MTSVANFRPSLKWMRGWPTQRDANPLITVPWIQTIAAYSELDVNFYSPNPGIKTFRKRQTTAIGSGKKGIADRIRLISWKSFLDRNECYRAKGPTFAGKFTLSPLRCSFTFCASSCTTWMKPGMFWKGGRLICVQFRIKWRNYPAPNFYKDLSNRA